MRANNRKGIIMDYQIEKNDSGQWIITGDSETVSGPFNVYAEAEQALADIFTVEPLTDFRADPAVVKAAFVKTAYEEIKAEIEHEDNFKQMLYESPDLLHAFWEFAADCRSKRIENF